MIIATGTVPKEFSVEVNGAAEIHRSVLDLKHRPPERTVIVGGGEAALDYALNLSDSGSSISILVRSSHLKVTGKLRDEAECRSGVVILYNTVPLSVSRLDGIIRIEAESSGRIITLESDAVLAAVGREPRLPRILDDFIHDRGNVKTSMPGLFLVGDASLGSLGQAGIAVGQGIMAAALAVNHLKKVDG